MSAAALDWAGELGPDMWTAADEIRDQVDRAWVRLQHAHPLFFQSDYPIPEPEVFR